MSNHLFEIIGTLFYAIAKADGSLAFEEYVKFSQLLEKYWQDKTKGQIDVIKKKFNSLQKDDVPAADCFNQFLKYVKQHPEEFTNEFKDLILMTADAIAFSYSKFNKSELHYLTKLRLEFKKNTK